MPVSSLSDVYRDVIPLALTVDSHKACSINEDTLLLRCHSFLSVFVTNVTYGRTASKVRSINKPYDEVLGAAQFTVVISCHKLS